MQNSLNWGNYLKIKYCSEMKRYVFTIIKEYILKEWVGFA